FELAGIVDGRPAIVLEHVTRLRPDTAPQWPAGEHGPGYYVEVEGDPRIRCHLSCVGPDGDHHSGGILVTATRIVNAIPAVCAATRSATAFPAVGAGPPGALWALELRVLGGRGLSRRGGPPIGSRSGPIGVRSGTLARSGIVACASRRQRHPSHAKSGTESCTC